MERMYLHLYFVYLPTVNRVERIVSVLRCPLIIVPAEMGSLAATGARCTAGPGTTFLNTRIWH